MALLCMAARCTHALHGAAVRILRGVRPAHGGGLAAALQKRRTSPAALQHRWTTHLAATGDAAVDAIDADAALQTVSDAQWAPILQEIRGKAGGPGAVAALRRAVAKYGAAPDAAYASIFPFELDEYQIEALQHLRNDSNVIVSAPTGSGKTGVMELALARMWSSTERERALRAEAREKIANIAEGTVDYEIALSKAIREVKKRHGLIS